MASATQTHRSGAANVPLEDEPPLIDQEVMRDWCDDLDREDVLGLIARVPGECATCVADIKAAIAANDVGAAKRKAHRLKGMASNLGAARLARIARQIELMSHHIGDVSDSMPLLEKTLADTLKALHDYPV
jgi:hypothetical protein